MSADDLQAVVMSINKDKLSQREVAVRHQVSTRLVQQLVSESKNNPNYLEPHRLREEKRKQKLKAVVR